jgi:hypothetical protein
VVVDEMDDPHNRGNEIPTSIPGLRTHDEPKQSEHVEESVRFFIENQRWCRTMRARGSRRGLVGI